jgi:integrase/recombinase XerD
MSSADSLAHSSPRPSQPDLSAVGEEWLSRYAQTLSLEEDLRPASIRNYLSDVRQFAAWCERSWGQGTEQEISFDPARVATPTLTAYRAHLQTEARLQPASVNRALISLKRYFGWCIAQGFLSLDPAKVVKLVEQTVPPPRNLTDQEEQALVATVTATSNLRDRAIIVILLHTGLRVGELCRLTRASLRLGTRSGTVTVCGKRNRYREIPLNATVRAVLTEYLAADPTLQAAQPHASIALFRSTKTQAALTERAVGYLIKKYSRQAQLSNVHPHDLRHRFGYRMAASIPLHRVAQLMGHDSLDTTLIYVRGTQQDLQQAVETIAWV